MEIETIEKQATGDQMKGVKSCKNFKTFLQGKINHFLRYPEVKYTGTEIQFLLKGLMESYNYFENRDFKEKRFKHEIEILDGWKGKDIPEIYRGFDNDFIIKVHLKDKATGDVKTSLKTIKKEDLNRILQIIKKLPCNSPVDCYTIALELGYASWKELWKERKQYFRFYYYPIKICESLKLISYGGRGEITRLK